MNKISFIEKGVAGNIDFRIKGRRKSFLPFLVFFIVVLVFLFVLLGRLFQLTIVKGAYYRVLADQNRIREIIIEPQRGKLIDRKGIVLTENLPADVHDDGKRIVSKRVYGMPEATSHVIGYRQVADPADLQADSCLNKLALGDKVGKKGVEKLFECQLRGTDGKKLVEVNALGKYMRTLSVVDPQPGETLQLALDSQLQQKTYDLIENQKAVVIGIKPKTGEVLILVSSPAYNPQVFEDGDSVQAKRYINNSDKPLFNRATEGTYPPGSTFKLVLAAGSLEDKTITPETEFEDNGFIKAGSAIFHNWYYLQYGKTDGLVNIIKGIQRSNDVFFYQVGAKMGPEKIKKWAETFGFQRDTNIGIEEADGLIPSPFWKEDVLHEQWYLGDTYNLSIGQGFVTVTPLQMAMATSVFANDGYLCQPQLLKQQTGEVNKKCKKLPLSASTVSLVREGMEKACAPGGTGWPFFEFKVRDVAIPVAPFVDQTASPGTDLYPASPSASLINDRPITVGCKTGTAESHGKNSKAHAWFTVFAPFDKPEIVLIVLIEEGGQGSDVAAPIAKEILTAYFERNQ